MRGLRNALGLSLFGVDLIVERQTGRCAAIDLNAFPGPAGGAAWRGGGGPAGVAGLQGVVGGESSKGRHSMSSSLGRRAVLYIRKYGTSFPLPTLCLGTPLSCDRFWGGPRLLADMGGPEVTPLSAPPGYEGVPEFFPALLSHIETLLETREREEPPSSPPETP